MMIPRCGGELVYGRFGEFSYHILQGLVRIFVVLDSEAVDITRILTVIPLQLKIN